MTTREIDTLIAEKVMGWKRWMIVGMEDIGCCLFPPERNFTSRLVRAPDGMPLNEIAFGSPFNCFTDPAASKKLRGKMRADGWEFAFRDEPPVFVASFDRPLPDLNCYEAEADTEEMAVALAALKAVGVDLQEPLAEKETR